MKRFVTVYSRKRKREREREREGKFSLARKVGSSCARRGEVK